MEESPFIVEFSIKHSDFPLLIITRGYLPGSLCSFSSNGEGTFVAPSTPLKVVAATQAGAVWLRVLFGAHQKAGNLLRYWNGDIP